MHYRLLFTVNIDIVESASKWIEPEKIILTEVIQTQKGKHRVTSLICGSNSSDISI